MSSTTVRVAQTESCPLFCTACGEFYSEEQTNALLDEDKTTCACGKTQYGPEKAGVAIRVQDGHLLQDEAVLATTWFHATSRENWASAILELTAYAKPGNAVGMSEPMVHLGSIEAAKDRTYAMSMADTYPESFWLYEVRLKPGTQINPIITDDHGGAWPEVVAECGGPQHRHAEFTPGVTRYVNAYESHGSISLLAQASCIEVVSRVQIDPLTFSFGQV